MGHRFINKHLGRFYPGFDMQLWESKTNGRAKDFNAFMLKLLCNHAHDECLNDCFKLFQIWKESVESGEQIYIHPYIKDALFPTISQYGSQDDWEYLYNRTEK